ncbi:MAG TPA: ABC transporter substrate-binding protein [Devosiaceae bacterium]
MSSNLPRLVLVSAVGALIAGGAAAATLQGPVPLPVPPSINGTAAKPVPYDQLMSVKALDHYSEPAWVTKLVEQGKLPAVKDRLPDEPIVMNMAVTPDGVGTYGGVFRHVSGARPQGWNWMAGQHQGYFGLDMTHQECLLNTAGMWELTADKQDPLPNLATSWEWSDDGHQLTMHLLKNAKWSDGQPFSADDIMFFWNDNVLDPKVASKMTSGSLGEGTTLEKLDDNTIRFTFKAAFPVAQLYNLAYPNFCPGPAHILKPLHPKYNKDATYESYTNALKPEKLPWVTMGPWAAVKYEPDQFIVARRNPYYFKVDSAGNQLPYMDEVQWRLSTKQDRDIQTVAGNADYTNFSDPSSYGEAIKAANAPNAKFNLNWGPRAFDWRIDLNLSEVCGIESPADKALRDLFRNVTFRRAFSQAIDRVAMGQSLVRGPFTAPFPGGIHPESGLIDPQSSVYYPYDLATAKALLAQLGFKDTDGDGIVNWTEGALAGKNLEFGLTYTTIRTTDVTLADSAISFLRDAGLRLVARPSSDYAAVVRDTCKWDAILERGTREFQAPITSLSAIAPLSYASPDWHRGTPDHPQELLPFEKEIVGLARKIQNEPDAGQRYKEFSQLQHVFTENVYSIGLITASSAIAINNRLKNVVPGTPGLAFQFGELNLMRERIWIPKDRLGDVPELAPDTVPVEENGG